MRAPSHFPGLPRVMLPPSQRRDVGLGSPALGSTTTTVSAPFPRTVSVAGQPSLQLSGSPSIGSVTGLKRQSIYTDYITDDEIELIKKWAQKVLLKARAMSRGPLTRKMLAERNYPYGRGTFAPSGRRRRGLGRLQGNRRGVSNLAIANSQTGALARSWSVMVERHKGGVTIYLRNSTKQGYYLSHGTAKMKAHGPATTAIILNLYELNQLWLQLTKAAALREQSMDVLGQMLGGALHAGNA